MLDDNCYAVVMAGGYGTRLWPLSSKNKPKHLLKLFDGKCLIELILEKLKNHIPYDRILILTNTNYKKLVQEILTNIPPENFIFEPCVRDTASAIGLAATILKKRCESATMIMLTADQIIEPADRFNTAITQAAEFLEEHPEMLVAFGVEAAFANTRVGWQQLGEPLDFPGCEIRKIVAFTEKPDIKMAQKYMEAGNYYWNSGQFAWKADTILHEIEVYLPEAIPLLKQIGEAWNTGARVQILHELFPQMPKVSIDYTIMQKTNKACSIFLPCSWEDMGTLAALVEKIGTKYKSNLVAGKAVVMGTGNQIMNHTDKSVVVAVDNINVVVTDNTVFIGDPNMDMKALIESLSQEAPEIL